MITCPACGATVNADFGMVACSKCDTVFMVEIDGTVTLPSADESHNVEPLAEEIEAALFEEPAHEPVQEEAITTDSSFEEPASESPMDYSSPTEGVVEYESASESAEDPAPDFAASESLPEDVAADESTAEEPPTEYSEDFLNSMGDTPAPVEDPQSDPLGVSRFDASEASQMADGPYYYDLRVSGIDTAILKQQVIDVLSDKRLNWSPDEIKKMIKMGQLTLENLNPVRAVLAVLRLQGLDVDVEWDQKPFTADQAPSQEQET